MAFITAANPPEVGAVARRKQAAVFLSGMLAALALLSGALGIRLREGVYLWYAATVGAFAAHVVFATRGDANAASVACYLLALGMLTGFARAFLDLPARAPRLWRALLALYAVVAAGEAMHAAFAPLASTAFLVALFGAGIAELRRGAPLARDYSVALAGVVPGLLVGVAGAYGVVPASPVVAYAPGVGVAWGALVLALALADRIRMLAAQARTDALTGIANRGAFDLRLLEEWRRGARTRARLAIVMIDVDRFKAYNDRCGHLRGDRVLAAVARAISETVRRPEDLVARYGGEEFAVVLPGCSREDAARIAEAVRAAVRALAIPHPASEHGRVTISAGVASAMPRHDLSPATLVAAADRALYGAKERGRNRVSMGAVARVVSA